MGGWDPFAMQAMSAYIAGMKNIQYTIRGIPAGVDAALRRRGLREGKSLNAVLVEALARGLELDAVPVEHTDLDELIGSWQEDPGFDAAVAEFSRIDEEAWK